MNNKRILVTGCNGLIGRALVQRLQLSENLIVGFDRTRAIAASPTFIPVEGDLRQIHEIYNVLKRYDISHVVHCGAISGPMVARDSPHTICDINVTGTLNVLEASRVMNVERFVYCSSVSAYGDTPAAPVTEDAPLRPTDVYGATKASGDLLVQAYAKQGHLDAVALRICWVFGPHRQTDCIIRTLLQNGLENRPTNLEWGIGFHRQFIYVEDVAIAILTALEVPSLPRLAYNITGGQRIKIEDVVKTVELFVPPGLVTLAPGPDPMDCLQEEFDISAAHQDLGYVPHYSFEQGVRAYFEWLCKH